MVEEFPPIKYYIVAVYNNNDYCIYCSSDYDRAFDWETETSKKMDVMAFNATEDIYFFGADSLKDIITMYGHHFEEKEKHV